MCAVLTFLFWLVQINW